MQICRYLRISGPDKRCEAGVCPVKCFGCPSFQVRRPFDPPTHQMPEIEKPGGDVKLVYTGSSSIEEQASKFRAASSITGSCGCHKKK